MLYVPLFQVIELVHSGEGDPAQVRELTEVDLRDSWLEQIVAIKSSKKKYRSGSHLRT